MVVLDGREVSVTWVDGDTFRVGGTQHLARLAGYNTLETYGDVHRWGTWKPAALHALASQATALAGARPRTCVSLDRPGGYGRDLVSCPDTARALVGAGLALQPATAVAFTRSSTTMSSSTCAELKRPSGPRGVRSVNGDW
jgi:endonuclease YncB( thermonuclease family)